MKPRVRSTSPARKSADSRPAPKLGVDQPVKLHENPWFSVWRRGGYYTVEYQHPQVIILPVVDNQGVVLVRVRRPVIDDTPLELPAGGVEPGETVVAAAAREFTEETGIVVGDAARFSSLPSLSPSPNRIPQRIHVFRVDITREEFDQRGPHDEEIAGIECASLEELTYRIIRGDIYAAAPVAVIAAFLLSPKTGAQSGVLRSGNNTNR